MGEPREKAGVPAKEDADLVATGTLLRPMALRGSGLIVLAAIYVAAAKLGLSMAFAAEQVSAVWPPSGIALAAVLLFGNRVWPGIAAGAFLVNITTPNETIGTASAIALGNTLEALVGAALLRRLGFHNELKRMRDVLLLLALAAGLSTTISATIGVASLCHGGIKPWSEFRSLWWIWWFGDLMGDLVVAPVLLSWGTSRGFRRPRRIAEAVILFVGLVITCWLVFAGHIAAGLDESSLAYSIFPFVIWAALRFGQRGTTTVTLIAASLAITGTIHGLGPFSAGSVHQRLLLLHIFLAVVALTGMLLAAALSERRLEARRVSVLHAISRILAESATLAEATPRIIQTICDSMAWKIGAMWQVDREARVLRCVDVHHCGPERFADFEAECRQRTFERGIGLPGRVWASGQPAWIPDVLHDSNFPRMAVAAKEGLHGAVCFPIELAGVVLGTIEFFSPEIRQPDPDVLRLMATIGRQIGQFIELKRGEEATRESDARKTAILTSALDAIVIMDHQGRIIEFNPAAERTFGYTRDEAIGQPMDELIIPAPLRQQHRDGLARFLSTGIGRILGERIELTALRSDGSEFPVELTVMKIPFPGPPTFAGFVRDITDRRRLEQDVLRRVRQLADADRRKDEFLATLAHELRNPLAPIRSGLEILRLSQNDGAVQERVQAMMERQMGHMIRLVDDLLDVSRINHNKLELRKERVDLATVLRSAVEACQPALAGAGHEFNMNLPSEPIALFADPVRITQVVGNLLNNACKFTKHGGKIELTARRDEYDAIIIVRDTGVGIPTEKLQHVFDMFAQIGQPNEHLHGGLGIGLSLALRLIELHGGNIAAHSAGPGQGSEFTVRIPAGN